MNQNNRIVFGIGSNLGDRQDNICKAISLLTIHLQLTKPKQSFFLINPALLPTNCPPDWNIDFINIAFSADINTRLFPPLSILHTCKSIETQLGRKIQQKWSPRLIDIDILMIDNQKISLEPILTIPHYDLLNRSFFLDTTKYIEPSLITFFT